MNKIHTHSSVASACAHTHMQLSADSRAIIVSHLARLEVSATVVCRMLSRAWHIAALEGMRYAVRDRYTQSKALGLPVLETDLPEWECKDFRAWHRSWGMMRLALLLHLTRAQGFPRNHIQIDTHNAMTHVVRHADNPVLDRTHIDALMPRMTGTSQCICMFAAAYALAFIGAHVVVVCHTRRGVSHMRETTVGHMENTATTILPHAGAIRVQWTYGTSRVSFCLDPRYGASHVPPDADMYLHDDCTSVMNGTILRLRYTDAMPVLE